MRFSKVQVFYRIPRTCLAGKIALTLLDDALDAESISESAQFQCNTLTWMDATSLEEEKGSLYYLWSIFRKRDGGDRNLSLTVICCFPLIDLSLSLSLGPFARQGSLEELAGLAQASE